MKLNFPRGKHTRKNWCPIVASVVLVLASTTIGCGNKAPENKVTKTIVPKHEGKRYGGIQGDGAWEGREAGAPEEIPPPRDEGLPGEGVGEVLD